MEVRFASAFRLMMCLAGVVTYLILRQFGPADPSPDVPANPPKPVEPSKGSPGTSVPVLGTSTESATHPSAGQSR